MTASWNNGAYANPEQGLYPGNEQALRNYIATVELHHRLNRAVWREDQKITIHFLYFSASYWPAWETFYRACLADNRMDVKLIFLKRKEGELPEFPDSGKAQAFLEAEGIPYTPYEGYDPYEEQPHIIVYQSPYNDIYLHFARLKANYIKQAGIRPLYISYGIEYDMPRITPDNPAMRLNLLHYRQYVQLFAWKVIVMHPDIRDGFFRHCLAGGAHVAALGNPKFDPYVTGELPPLPGSLLAKASGRPVLAWQLHHFWSDGVSDPSRTHSLPFAETERMISWLCAQDRVFTVVTLHPLFAEDALRSGQATREAVARLKSMLTQSPNAALYEGPYQTLLAGADAFVTEKSSLMLEMAFLNKPVLLVQDLEVAFKPFAADVAASFYHGKGLEDLKVFLRIVQNPEWDKLAKARAATRERHFACCDGRVGERIKNRLIHSLFGEAIHAGENMLGERIYGS